MVSLADSPAKSLALPMIAASVLRVPTSPPSTRSKEKISALSDEQLRRPARTSSSSSLQTEPARRLLAPAFAVVREASRRALGMRPFDVQLIGGMILHSGDIAEMKTGEGKTLVATLPVYLNALAGKGVHVVTVNDYLAKRDAE